MRPINRTFCLPILSLAVLLYLKFIKKGRRLVIYYEILPPLFRAIIRFSSISEGKIRKYIEVIFRLKLQKIIHGNQVEDYHNLRMNVYIQITTLCDNYINEIEHDAWIPLLTSFFDKKSSLAVSLKFFSHKQLHVNLLSAKLCMILNRENTFSNIILINPSYWSKDLNSKINRLDGFKDLEFINLPLIFKLGNKLNNIIKITLIFIKNILRQGVTFRKIKKREFKLFSEFFDPAKVGGGVFDVDLLINNEGIAKKDVLFYITSRQSKVLKKKSFRLKELNILIERSKLNIINLKSYSYTPSFFLNLFHWYLKLIKGLFIYENSIVFNLLPFLLEEYLIYSPLFLHNSSNNHIHYINPNGKAPLLLNSGVITGICNKYGVCSVGIQNRIFDARQYEFCFDRYNMYFFWGDGWINMLGSALRFVDKKIVVGALNITKQMIIASKKHKQQLINETNKLKKKLSVIIFTSDIDEAASVYSGSFYSVFYTKTFLKSCLKLAKLYPDITFRCKLKDKHHLNIINEHSEFQDLNFKEYKNFEFVDRDRSQYIDLLLKSTVAISIGYTSPGLDALLLGKKSIYFSKLSRAGQVFKQVQDFVVNSDKELIDLFKKLYSTNFEIQNSTNFDLFDPYNDGKAISRIIKQLV